MLIFREFTFDAAHYLPSYKGKCAEMHGHTYKLQVGYKPDITANGEVEFFDFYEFDRLVKNLLTEKGYDHNTLNKILDNPMVENIAIRLMRELKEISAKFEVVRLYETADSWAELIDRG